MRLLLTSTLLAGVFLPFSPVWGQSASVDAMSTSPTVGTNAGPSSSASTTADQTNGSATNATTTNSARAGSGLTVLPQPRGRIQYPVGPVGPATPTSSHVLPAQPLQGPGSGSNEAIDPYAAQGLRLGSFVLYPSISFTAEATDNIDGTSVPAEGFLGKTEVELRAESDWNRHKLTVTTRAGVSGYNEPRRKPDTEQFMDGSLELDLADQSKLTLSGSAQRQREAANSVELAASGGTASVQSKFSAGAVLDQGASIFRFQLRSTLANEYYEEDKTRDFQTFTLGSRVGVQLTDQITPFVDVEVSRKAFRQSTNAQNGDSLRGSIGLEVLNRETFSGEASVGVMAWRPKVGGQVDDSMLFVDASLTWTPSALWTLTGGFDSSLSSTSTGASSVATYSADFEAKYALRDNLDLGLTNRLSREVYYGTGRRDTIFDSTLSAEYSFNRYSQLIATVGHQRRNSTQVGSGYTDNRVGLTLKLRR